ncbi:pectinesterase family protein [Pedobacter cryotolerans]|uniref:Pectinesterase n=1 Tax=Pedobacter cryotolerans TaxID=2571270 RepID=A0A4U1CA29_9SPHI|nr:pectinesterase family protein [Pedobacter cryotolerans]TKC02708.1 pectin esterase [Pedobacter cryotolerans]
MKTLLSSIFLFVSLSAIAQIQTFPTSFTVAKDGSGDFKTIQEAVMAVRDWSEVQVPIYIKKGIYKEKLVIPSQKTRITLIGESAAETMITFDDYSGKNGLTTYTSYTVLVKGNEFKAENLTFENSAGSVGQAVALHVEADKVIIKNCRILGNQDTLFPTTDTSRQYYVDCYIEGTTDFIFGAATAVFENCTIHSKKNSYITAASTIKDRPYGFVFLNCKLTASESAQKVYLGRPWRANAKTVFINTEMGKHILPEGWHVWNNNDNHKTTFYAEYGSTGPGFVKESRVSWSKQLTKKEAKQYTLKNIFAGTSAWLPSK